MKTTLNIVLILWISISFCQEKEEVFSVYFHQSALKDLTPLSSISKEYCKKYTLKENESNGMRVAAGENLIADETGVCIEKNKLLFVTREQVREESKYQVRNGYLFGVIKNDSVLTALDGEKYYFLIPAKTYLVDFLQGTSTLYQGAKNNEYLVLTKESNGHYSCIYFKFLKGALSISELNLSSDACSIKLVKDKETIEGDFNTYILKPTLKEWSSIFDCFTVYDEYVATK